jgi:hypothetical protein
MFPKFSIIRFLKSLWFLNFEDGGEHGKCDKVTANQAHNSNFQNYKFFEPEPPNKGHIW